MKSSAETVEQYLEELTPGRREAVSAVRDVILANLPEGYEERMDFGMIAYVVPLAEAVSRSPMEEWIRCYESLRPVKRSAGSKRD